MLFSPHWADPVRHALIDPVLLSRALAERKDKLVLLEGTPEPDRPHILRFMEREDPGEYLHLSDDAFRLLLWKYINFPRQAIKELDGVQTVYIADFDNVIPPVCQPLIDSFIEFFEDLPGTKIVTTTQSRPHHILRHLYYYGYDYCIYRFVM